MIKVSDAQAECPKHHHLPDLP